MPPVCGARPASALHLTISDLRTTRATHITAFRMHSIYQIFSNLKVHKIVTQQKCYTYT